MLSNFLIRTIWITSILLCSFISHGQQLNFRKLDASQGLPQNIIYDLVQDEQQFLWISTGSGLARYDGQNILPVPPIDSAQEDFVTSLCIDHEGTVWSGSFGGKVARFKNDRWESIQPASTSGPVRQIISFGPDTILFVWQNKGVACYHSGNIHPLLSVQNDEPILFQCLEKGNSQQVFIGTANGLIRGELRDGRLNDPQRVSFFADQSITKLFFHKQSQTLLVGTRTGGLFQWAQNATPKRVVWPQMLEFSGPVQAIEPLSAQKIGVGTPFGFYTVEADKAWNWKGCEQLGPKHGLTDPNVNAILADSEGSWWLGTFGSGLFQLPWNRRAIWRGGNEFPSQQVRAIQQASADNYLLATENGLVQLHFPTGPMGTKPWTNYSLQHYPADFAVNTLIRDSESNWFVGTDGSGLMVFDEIRGTYRQIVPDPRLEDAVITHLSKDAEGRLWVATLSHGVFILWQNPISFLPYEVERYSIENGLLHNDILHVVHDKEGFAWCLTHGTGLAKMRGLDFVYYTAEQGFQSLDFNCLAQDIYDAHWIGTAGRGLSQLSENTLTTFTEEDGLPSNYIYGLLPYEDQLLVQTRQMISLLDPEQGSFFPLHDLRNQTNFDLVQNALAFGPDGNLLIGSSAGLVMAQLPHPEALREQQTTVYFEQLEVSGNPVPTSEYLNLPYGQHRLRFGFQAILLNRLAPLYYQYRLDGYDTTWSEPNGEDFAYFTNLSNGSYSLRVRAGSSPNLSGQPEQTFNFTIATPLWKQVWFLVVLNIFLVALAFGLLRWREHRLIQANVRLEEVVEERTEEIRKQNEEIEQFTYAISHDLKTPVFNINGLLQMLRSTDPEPGEDREEIYDMLNDTSGHLRQNLERLMEVIKAKEAGKEERIWVNLNELLVSLKKNIHVLLQENEVEIQTELETEEVHFNAQNLYSILYNLVTNGVKYRSPDRLPVVKIRSRKTADKVILEVEDNGLGMDLERDGGKIFGMFQRIHDHVEGSGVGLHLIKKMVDNSGGYIEVESEPGKGSLFRVALPLD